MFALGTSFASWGIHARVCNCKSTVIGPVLLTFYGNQDFPFFAEAALVHGNRLSNFGLRADSAG